MKRHYKKILAILLIAVLLICAAFSIDIASAAQTENEVAADAYENVSAKVEAPVAEEMSVNSDSTEYVTEPVGEEEDATEPVTTVEPTTVPSVTTQLAVGRVANLRKVSAGTDNVVLEWDRTDGATGYAIYCCNADKTTEYSKISYVTSTKCTIKNLAHTTQYFFKVAAYIETNGIKYEGNGAIKKTATQPPEPKMSLKYAYSKIKIAWNQNSRATGYKVYKYNSNSKKYELYKVIGKNSTTSFTDTNVTNGKAYYYKVKAYRTLNTGCTYHSTSNATTIAFAGLNSVDFSMTSQLKRVSLSWSKNKYATGYEIYYATAQSGPYTRLAATTKTFYNTEHLTVGKTYYFRVRPYRLNGAKKTKIIGTYLTKSKKVSDKGYGNNVGKTYIEISIKQQHMWFYYNGKLYCETDVVTGNDDGYHNTPKGAHKIYQRMSPATLVGADYVSYVTYWMAFTYSGCGIHDASWRSSGEYGGTTYKGNGSHGCVNTPKTAVKKIYEKARVGNYVVIY